MIKYLFSPSFFLRKGGENTFVKTFLSVDLTEKYEILILARYIAEKKAMSIDLSLEPSLTKFFCSTPLSNQLWPLPN